LEFAVVYIAGVSGYRDSKEERKRREKRVSSISEPRSI
jgi:hypothetical protein